MTKNHRSFTTRAMVVAVHGALLAMAAMPVAYAEEDPAVAELTHPTKSVELGVRDVSSGSYKAGEYNGLEKKGASAVVNMDVRGGSSYDSEDTKRWRITGNELGLETRNLTTEYGQQGKFNINFGYDELLRNRSDSYQTPYIGAGSSNVLTLPSTWLAPQINAPWNGAVGAGVAAPNGNPYGFSLAKINSQVLIAGTLQPAGSSLGATGALKGIQNTTAQAAANVAASTAALNADAPLFHNVNLSTKRTKTDVGFSYNIDPQWEVRASVRREDKNGYKPMSTVSAKNSEIATTIADKIDTTTNQYNVSLGYTDEIKFLKAAYYVSLFENNVKSMSWADWSSATPGTDIFTMSSAPSNQFHQLSLNGGYNIDKTTKLVMNTSYSRNTQNDPYISSTGFGVTELGLGVPVPSANALVVTKAFDAKLTFKPSRDWNFAANYKFDERDNQTAVHNYVFGDAGLAIGGTALTATNALWNTTMLGWAPPVGTYVDGSGNILAPTLNIEANRPYSKKVNQFNLDATYALAKGQTIRAGFDHQQIDRSCSAVWIDCVDADQTKENILRLDWRASLVDDMTVKLGYARSKRTVSNYNENAFLALVPMAQYAPAGATANAAAGGLSFYQTMQAFGITGFGLNTGYLSPTTLTTMFPTATAAQRTALLYYFGASTPSLVTTATNGTNVGNNQFGYASRNRISELIGMRRYNMADRDRDAVKAGVDWNATEQLSLQGSATYKNDDYKNSVYGLTGGKDWGMNLDAAFAASDSLSFSAFYNYEDRSSTMANDAFGTNNDGVSGTNGVATVTNPATGATVNTGATQVVGGCYATVALKNQNAKTDPCLKWSANMKDKVDTLGFTVKKNNLMASRLDVTGVLLFTRARTDTNVTGGSYVQNPLLTATTGQTAAVAFYYIPAAALPSVTTNTVELKLNGKYKLDKASAVHMGYNYQHMKAVNYAYDGMQMATVVGNTLPTNETAPSYTVHAIAISYIYSFQ